MMVMHGGERRLLDELDALDEDHGPQREHHYRNYRSQHHDEPGLRQNVIGQVVIDGVPGDQRQRTDERTDESASASMLLLVSLTI